LGPKGIANRKEVTSQKAARQNPRNRARARNRSDAQQFERHAAPSPASLRVAVVFPLSIQVVVQFESIGPFKGILEKKQAVTPKRGGS
jgi:hypothetical protein